MLASAALELVRGRIQLLLLMISTFLVVLLSTKLTVPGVSLGIERLLVAPLQHDRDWVDTAFDGQQAFRRARLRDTVSMGVDSDGTIDLNVHHLLRKLDQKVMRTSHGAGFRIGLE
jgi:hypothetical protein